MSTPHDTQRTAAFSRWVIHVGGLDAAGNLTGISRRTLQRMTVGKQPPPVRLLERLADQLARQGGADTLADALALAARPAEATHA